MPDLGRWHGIDQLSEKYLSTSPYAYVANNPISFVDPDGRWMDEAGHIDVSGKGKIYFGGRQLMTQFMGQTIDQGAGGYNFSGNGAVSMFNYFANGGDINGLSFNNGYAIFWTNGDMQGFGRVTNDEMEVGGTEVVLNRVKLNGNNVNSFIDNSFNWIQSHPREFTSIAGAIEGSSQIVANGLKNWNAPSSITKSHVFAEVISTRLPASAQALGKFSTVLKWGGRAVGAVGIANSLYQGYNGNISTTRAAVDTVMGVVGFIGPWGAAASLVYFGGMAVYEHYYNDDKSTF
ncbi:hypothetical protein AMQ68_09770 [Chryseobacterium sp. ERMR1:04]|nr:hypothetical protein AMQ68_09770 [Chryseobacterium sp. ERMR1:04]